LPEIFTINLLKKLFHETVETFNVSSSNGRREILKERFWHKLREDWNKDWNVPYRRETAAVSEIFEAIVK